MLFIMDVYLRELYMFMGLKLALKVGYHQPFIINNSHGLAQVAQLVQQIKGQSNIIFNYNEEGKLHSKYLGDRYEPAIIIRYDKRSMYCYLFDGEIKDCIHPFSIEIIGTERYIDYYSSERIEQELPIRISRKKFNVFETYNEHGLKPLLEGYKSGKVEIEIADYPEQDYLLHDCMESTMTFKFAD